MVKKLLILKVNGNDGGREFWKSDKSSTLHTSHAGGDISANMPVRLRIQGNVSDLGLSFWPYLFPQRAASAYERKHFFPSFPKLSNALILVHSETRSFPSRKYYCYYYYYYTTLPFSVSKTKRLYRK